MAYIDIKYLGKCETCRHYRSGTCNTFCDCGEEYSPDLSKIPTADVVEVCRCEKCNFYEKFENVEDFDGRCALLGVEVDKDFYCQYGRKGE